MALGVQPYTGLLTNRLVALDQVDSAYLQAEDFMMQRDLLSTIEDTFQEKDFLTYLELSGRSLVAKNNLFSHYETRSKYRAVSPTNVTATAATATFRLNAASYTNVQSIKGSLDRSPLKIGDEIMIPGGDGQPVWGYITAKSGSGITTTFTAVRRNGSTEDIGAALTTLATNGTKFGVPSQAFGEGSGQPEEGLDDLPIRFIGQMQIFKQMKRITGDADSNMTVFEFNGKNYYWLKMTPEMLLKQRMDIAFATMFSPGGSFVNASGLTIPLTTGAEGYIASGGQNIFYDKNVGITIDTLHLIAGTLKAASGCREYIWTTGARQRQQIETILSTRTGNGGIVYTDFGFGKNSAERAVDLGFDSFKIDNIVFHMQESRALEHPEVTACNPALGYDDFGLLFPANNMKVSRSVDGEIITGMLPSIAHRYKVASDGTSRRMIQWENDRRTNGGFDTRQTNVQSQEGMQMTGVIRFARVKGV